MAWVKERNAEAEKALVQGDFAATEQRLLEILDSHARIPAVEKHGRFLYNFWRDAKNPRGVWRRTTLDEYRKADPRWETVLDLDALRRPRERELGLEAGGLPEARGRPLPGLALARRRRRQWSSASSTSSAKAFVRDGFALPEAKSDAGWRDRGRALRGDRLRPRLAHPAGLPARREELEARHAAGHPRGRCSRAGRRRRRQRLSRHDPRLRARLRAPRPSTFFSDEVFLRGGRPADQARQARRRGGLAAAGPRCSSPCATTGPWAGGPTRPARCSRRARALPGRRAAASTCSSSPASGARSRGFSTDPPARPGRRARQRPQPPLRAPRRGRRWTRAPLPGAARLRHRRRPRRWTRTRPTTTG